jgi:hypothetical protein
MKFLLTNNSIVKSKNKFLVLLLAMILSSALFTKTASAQETYVSFQVFYDQLSPYGQWIDYPNYGYVWIPDVGSDFSPYSTEGHWIFTDYGWTWVSDYSWGWAPFHYGRWDYDNSFGWFWVPDNEWGPAWVIWRRADGYYGWEPMQPGISINGSFGSENRSKNEHWIFVRDRYIDSPNISRYNVNKNSRDQIIKTSTVVTNTYNDNRRNTTYISGPKKEDVQRFTGKQIKHVAVQENNKPGQNLSNGELHIYRPQVKKINDVEHKPAPSKVGSMNDVNSSKGKYVKNQQKNSNKQQKVNQSTDKRKNK